MHRSIPDIIGRNGTVIKQIQDSFKVKLNIPDTSNRDASLTKVRVGVAGMKDNVAQAKDVIKEITQYFYSRVTHPDYTHVEMDVPVPSYSLIIGAKGSEIRHIQSNFKVSVHIPNSESFSQKVLIVGTSASVQKATSYIEKMLLRAETRQEEYEAGKVAGERDSDEPHEEWMDKYTYKRPAVAPSPAKDSAPVELPEASVSPSASVDETKPTWRNIAATSDAWAFQQSTSL